MQRFTSAVGSIKGMKHGIHASLVLDTPTDQELLAKSVNVMAEQNDEMCYGASTGKPGGHACFAVENVFSTVVDKPM